MKTGPPRSSLDLLRHLGCCCALLSVLLGSSFARTQDDRPNILVLMADDWNWPHSAGVDDPNIETPTFDRIAREGVLFRNAFVASPSCTPSRASLLTGKHPWQLETGVNLWGPLPAKFTVYPDLLEKAGYHVGFSGKGWGPGVLKDSGRDHNPAGKIKVRRYAEFFEERPEGKPFCFWFNSPDPHRPYEWQSGVKRGMKLEEVVVPPILPDTEKVRTDLCDYYFEVERFDRVCGKLLDYLEELGELDDTLVVMTGDNGMPFPRAKASLYDLGTKVPLVMRWPGHIAAGRVVDDLVAFPDLAPTFVELAGLEPPADMRYRSLVEILEAGGSGWIDPTRKQLFFTLESHCGRYPVRAVRTDRWLYLKNYEIERPVALCRDYWESEAGYSPTWLEVKELPIDDPIRRRIEGARAEQELYDVVSDPFQLTDLAADPAHAGILAKLAKMLETEQRETGDPRLDGRHEEVFYDPHENEEEF